MGALYNSLNFPSSMQGNVREYDDKTKKHMSAVKIVSNDDEYSDVLNNRVNGYYVNPVGPECNTISSIASSCIMLGTPPAIGTAANNLILASTSSDSSSFLRHTNRLSGLEPELTEETGDKPTLELALNIGRQLSYVLYQTEGIDDNSVTLGSFSSLYTKANLTNYISTITGYPGLVSGSITFIPGGEGSGDTYTSSLSESQISQIVTSFNNIKAFMDGKRTDDEQYYLNSREMLTKFKRAGSLTASGLAHKQLVNDVIGTDYSKERVNKS
jgi:hypothetical protein